MAAIDIKVSPENLLDWSGMEDWDAGASAAPTEHVLSGASATIAREATIIKVGTYSAAVTRSGTNCMLYHDLPTYANYKGRKVTFGCWAYATVASRVRISINDGVGSTTSSLHSGVAGWEFLTVTRNIDSSATQIRVQMEVITGNTTGYFDNGILCEGDTTYIILTDISDVGNIATSNKYSGQSYKIARRIGSKVPSYEIESKTIQVEGMVTGATPTAMRTNHDALQKILNSFRVKANDDQEMRDLYLFDDRFWRGYLSGNEPKNRAAVKVRDYALRFIIPTPFERSVNKYRSKQTISSSPTTFTVSVVGNAITFPFISVLNSGSNISSLTIQNLTTGQTFAYTGSIVTAESLEVDCDLLVIENNNVEDMANHTGDLDMFLMPGDNQIKITGLAAGTVKVDWFDRWF